MTNNRPLVSVIIPVYNVENYVERCLNSIFSQTFQNLEIILVNDCTPDNSMAVVESLLRNRLFSNVKILVHQENRGLSEARNTGILAATGEYVFFLDSDDILPNDGIKHLVDLVYKYGTDLDLVQGNFDSIPNGWFTQWNMDTLKVKEYINDTRWLTERFFARDTFPVMACNRLIRRQLLLDNNVFFKKGIIHEDEHFNFFLIKHLRSLAYTREKTYIYIQNKEGITQSEDSEVKSILSYKLIVEDWVKNISALNKDLQLNFVFKTSYDLFHYSKFKDFVFLECLFPLFPVKFGETVLRKICSKEIISKLDIIVILFILKIEKTLAAF